MALNVWGGLNAWPGATSYTLVADTGNYAYTGTSVTLTKSATSYTLIADAGVYAYTGTSVTLTKSGAAGSTLNLTITGIPDGSYMTVLDDSDGIRVQRQNEVYSSQQVSIALSVNVGTTIKGYVDDSLNPSSSGAYIEGVTE